MAKILIIDDSGFQRKLIRSILEDEGYTTVSAEEGNSGFALALKDAPDLIICDLLMPGCDGYTFLKKAGEHHITTRILIVTSDIQKASRQECLDLGAADVLYKPVTRESLVPAIEKALGR